MYLAIFAEAFGSAQLIAFSSHTTFFALRGFGGEQSLVIAALCALAGGALGQMVNWGLGRLLLLLREQGRIHISDETYSTARQHFQRFFLPLLLFSWFGLVSVLVVAAGFFRIRWWIALAWITAGYAGYFGWVVVS